MRYEVRVGARRVRLETDAANGLSARLLVDGRVIPYDVREITAGRHWSIVVGARAHEVALLGGDPLRMWVDGVEVRATVMDERTKAAGRGRARAAADRHEVRAPMPGLLKAIHVRDGDLVERGTALATLEAMKMENELRSPLRGRVQRVAAAEGTKVESGALIAVIVEVP